ncbi:SDR family NAD(P)-dependent oxidoreductase [Sphingobium aromaticivastans]|uniref:SDR family NAD(P)-dependent oxidoreductase n=1 Tax=Sphingobium aromaticivastans TaxID=1778665 RepID=UPI00301733CA
MGSLDGKVAIVTGGARGQGASHVKGLMGEGARVYITDIQDEDGRRLAETLGDGCVYLNHDVSSEEDWTRVIDTVGRDEGKLDILVNNAGIYHPYPIGETTSAFFEKIFCVNQLSVFLGMKAAADLLRKSDDGAIVNIASVVAMRGFAQMIGYGSTKWAIRGMTRTAAQELAPYVRVNTVCPGFVDTSMLEVNAQEFNQSGFDAALLKRPGRPQEITDLVLFLASPKASFITGSEFVIDGGLNA